MEETVRTELLLPNLNLTEIPGAQEEELVSVTNTSLLHWPDWSHLLHQHHQLCSSWESLHHIYYQAAHLVLVLVTVFPLRCGSVTVLLLRLGLVLHSTLTLLPALLISCNLDTLCWALLLLTVNLTYTIQGVYRVYTSHCSHIQPDLRPAFDSLFKPLGVSRAQYKVSHLI